MNIPLGAGKQSKLMAISVVPSFNYVNSKRTRVRGFTLVQTLDNAVGTAEKTTFNGQPAYLLDQTTQPTCTGDEAGWAGGVKSGTVGGEVKPTSGTSSILIEGKQLVRHGDSCTMNNGNAVGKYVAVNREVPLRIIPIRELPNLNPLFSRTPKPSSKITPPKIELTDFSPLSSDRNLTRPVTNTEMYAHYVLGNGESLTLDNLGTTELVSNVILKRGAFGKEGSIQTRFTEQIAEKFLEGDTNYTFDNGYDVGSEIDIWAFGSGDISGKFSGDINQLQDGSISVIGEVTYQFSDIFQDPYDTFDWVEGSWDPNGIPYKITGTIKHNINDVVNTGN